MNLRIKFRIAKSGDRDYGVSGIISKHWNAIFIFLWFVEIDIYWIVKDWMIEGTPTISNGKTYETWTKNPEYINEEWKDFVFPKTK